MADSSSSVKPSFWPMPFHLEHALLVILKTSVWLSSHSIIVSTPLQSKKKQKYIGYILMSINPLEDTCTRAHTHQWQSLSFIQFGKYCIIKHVKFVTTVNIVGIHIDFLFLADTELNVMLRDHRSI